MVCMACILANFSMGGRIGVGSDWTILFENTSIYYDQRVIILAVSINRPMPIDELLFG
jgi:hypothetical protein